MNEEMKIRNDYRETFSEVHAPEILYRKVKNMSKMEKKKKSVSIARRWVAVVAIAALLFVGSNGVAYAATGSTWLETVVVYINGSSYTVDLEEKVDENGTTFYKGTFKEE